MPSKAKDENLNETIKKVKKETTNKVAKKTTTKKEVTSKKTTKTVSAKKKVSNKKKTSANVSSKSSTNKAATTKKVTKTDKSTSKKSTTKKLATTMEYYDLPSVYNKTVVKILVQTPSCIFVYWEVSEEDKSKLQKQYGEDFFKNTKPYLVIINETMNYSFEVEINDYSNSWYVPIHDANCKYSIKLIRKTIQNENNNSSSEFDIITSNEMNTPNDHILFDKLGKTVFFKNIKTNIVKEQEIASISFMNHIGSIYNIYDLYKEIYKNELNGDELGVSLSSSQFSSR